MKVEIPETLKSDIPQTTWGKTLSATPVVMAVVSTMLAALSTSEMSRAQYDRSLAAQQQSKAGDQWSFFQAKRLRGSMQRGTLDLLTSMAPVRPLTADSLSGIGVTIEPGAMAVLESGRLPRADAPPELPSAIADAMRFVEEQKVESEIRPALARVSEQQLADALRAARDNALALETLTAPVNKEIERLDAEIGKVAPVKPGEASVYRDFTTARLRYAAARYEAEARANQAVASLYELQVRKSNLSAQRHHTRSQRLFFGMLAAQAGVIIATFAMAARKRNFLWSVAAAAGIIAVVFAIYVYLYV
jgi:hypothetical protein